MKIRIGSLLFVFVILGAVAIAGCTTTSNNDTSQTVSPTVSGPTPTPLPEIGSTVTVNNTLDFTKINWYKYQIIPTGTVKDLGYGFTTEGSTMTERWDFNVNYNGKNADKVTGTGNYPSNGGTGSTIEFLDHADHKQVLGGNMTAIKNGDVIYQGAITSTLLELQSLLDLNNSTYTGQHTVIYGGTETVTVPSGTYTTIKYLYNGAYNLTIYQDPGVQVPIKVNAVGPYGTIYDIELMGWG